MDEATELSRRLGLSFCYTVVRYGGTVRVHVFQARDTGKKVIVECEDGKTPVVCYER